MNYALFRQDIEANRDKLPSKGFGNGYFYNVRSGCYCVLGWLSPLLGGPDAKEGNLGKIWDFFADRYRLPYETHDESEGQVYSIATAADNRIRALGTRGFGRDVIAPAEPVIEKLEEWLPDV